MLRLIAYRVLSSNSTFDPEGLHLVVHVFSALVIAQSANLHASLILSESLELLRGRKCITLHSERDSSLGPSVVIDEGDPVPIC